MVDNSERILKIERKSLALACVQVLHREIDVNLKKEIFLKFHVRFGEFILPCVYSPYKFKYREAGI